MPAPSIPDLERRFGHHPPSAAEVGENHAACRELLLSAAVDLVARTGDGSREQSLMVTALEEAMFWANAAIARQQIPSPGTA